jgi:tetratricopeptide (TPR) repeat protein
MMFLRKMGRRILILHSYRDGRGKVCQRRLGDFSDAAGLERELGELPRKCPDFDCDVSRLRSRGQELLNVADGPRASPTDQARKALKKLLNWLAEEREVESLAPELATLRARLEEVNAGEATPLSRSRSLLPSRRRRFDSSDPKAQPYLQTLDQLVEEARQRGQQQEEAQILRERVSACPDSRSLLQYGALLQKLGQHHQAMEYYQRVPDSDGPRHYNLGAACWQLGEFDQALVHLLRGMARQPEIAEALLRIHQNKPARNGAEYWQEYGHLWDGLGRKFLLAIASQHLVRRRVRQVRENGTKVRSLVRASSRVWLLERGMAAVRCSTPTTGL